MKLEDETISFYDHVITLKCLFGMRVCVYSFFFPYYLGESICVVGYSCTGRSKLVVNKLRSVLDFFESDEQSNRHSISGPRSATSVFHLIFN